MNSKEEIKQILINALIDSVPDQQSVKDRTDDPEYFNRHTMGWIFNDLGIESLGRMWFVTIIEEQCKFSIKDPVKFFGDNENNHLSDIVEVFHATMQLTDGR